MKAALGRFRHRPDAIVIVVGLVGALAVVALWANGVRGVGIALLLGADVLALTCGRQVARARATS